MGTFTWTAGEAGTASKLQDMLPILKLKTALTSRASTTTNTADPDLVVTLRAGVTYRVVLNAGVIGNAAGDFKCSWTTTGTVAELSPTVPRGVRGMFTTGTDPRDTGNMRSDYATGTSTLATSFVYGTHATNVNFVEEVFFVQAGASGGTLTLAWSQGTSNATATQLLFGQIFATPVDLQ